MENTKKINDVNVTTSEKKPETAAEPMVTIKQSELEAVMERIKRLEFAADKSHLAHFDEKNKQATGKIVRLRTVNGKVVTSWSDMISNTVEKNPQGHWVEDQKVKIFYEDKTDEVMDLVIFNRRFTHIDAFVDKESEETDSAGNKKVIYKVTTADGREYSIDHRFIN